MPTDHAHTSRVKNFLENLREGFNISPLVDYLIKLDCNISLNISVSLLFPNHMLK